MSSPQSSDAPARRSDVGSPEPGASPWSPLRQAVFRAVWIAAITSNIGTWMQSVGAAWLMTSLTPSPLLVALMQTAASLPVFLGGLPAVSKSGMPVMSISHCGTNSALKNKRN